MVGMLVKNERKKIMEDQSLIEIEYSELWNIAPEWANFFGINDK